MFYRKYRPQKFSEISKPNDVAEALMAQLKSDKTAHAYLFTGSRGTGKTTTARIFAKALNCKHIDKSGDPCDDCETCTAIKNGNFLDLIEIDAASNRGIDDIRELKDKIKLAPAIGKKKVYIIDEVHMLTSEAFNALLKTLEEPPKHSIFILCTTELHKVPETIKSRCQVFKFKRATISQLVTRLGDISEKEGVQIAKDDLKKIAKAAAGGFRDADTLLQQVVDGNLPIDALFVSNSTEIYFNFVEMLITNDIRSAIRQLNKIYDDGADLYVWTSDLLKYLRDLLLISSGVGDSMVDQDEDLLSNMQKQAADLGTPNILILVEVFSKANNQIKSSVITQLPLEVAVLEFCAPVQNYELKKEDPPKSPKPTTNPPTGSTPQPRQVPPAQKPTRRVDSEPQEELTRTSDPTGTVELKVVEEKWEGVLKEALKKNGSIQALLKSSKPLKTEAGYIILEVSYSFHKERLENPKNRKIVEGVLKEVLNLDISIKCVVCEERPNKRGKETGVLTDYNVTNPMSLNDPALKDSLLKVFDGGLPML